MALCLECREEQKTVFDFRPTEINTKCRVYVIYEDGEDPSPTGFCLKCFLSNFERHLSPLTE